MGMTIDDNIDFLNDAKEFFEDVANNPSINETVKTYFIIESLETAMSTMRKYQKIQEIVKNINAMAGSNDYACAFIDIREVVKDGK